MVTMALNAWDTEVARTQQLISCLPAERLAAPVAPGKNRGGYLVGHLTAYHDFLFSLLELGPRQHPELDAVFLHQPDAPDSPLPTADALLAAWADVHEPLSEAFRQLLPPDWFARHTAVSAADFEREPHRNKLNVLLKRTAHLAYHRGQLRLLR